MNLNVIENALIYKKSTPTDDSTIAS